MTKGAEALVTKTTITTETLVIEATIPPAETMTSSDVEFRSGRIEVVQFGT
jgi:flagella basal body P-ring formation protein FlgA